MTNLRRLLALNMKAHRHSLCLSQAKLAEKVGTSTHYIGMIEVEKKFPTPEMLERIAKALEIDAPELFYPAKSPEPDQRFLDQIVSKVDKIITARITELKTELKRPATEKPPTVTPET